MAAIGWYSQPINRGRQSFFHSDCWRGGLLLNIAHYPLLAADAEQSLPIKIAVFDFELEDASPAASLLGETTNSATIMKKVSSEARLTLANSGHYCLIDVGKVDAKPVLDKSLRNAVGATRALRCSSVPISP